MEILLALGAAVSYGVSDFTGGILTRRAHVFVVFLLSQVVSLALLLVVVAVWADPVSWPGLAWGAVAGVAGVAGTSLLYEGLAIGRMSVVALVTGVLGAGLPVLVGMASAERPGPAALAGIVAGLVAVVVVTRSPEPDPASATPQSRQAILCAFGAGIGFGLFYVLLQRSPVDSGLWPLLGTRISLVGLLALLVAARVRSRPRSGDMAFGLVGLGIVNTLADLLFLLATRSGFLSLVAVITSMYPAATVALAALVLRERLAGRQVGGLVVAAASVGLIALG
jgi:drug/metabolite transporter (DMT)-like permease